jgi:hypothetical protein
MNISYMNMDKLASPRPICHIVFDKQPAGNGELRSDDVNETGAFDFFVLRPRDPEHSRLTLPNIPKCLFNGHKAPDFSPVYLT